MSNELMNRQSIESLVAKWRQLHEERLAADKVANVLKDRELEVRSKIVYQMNAQAIEGIVLDGRITGVRAKEQPVCSDRHALTEFIYDNKFLHLLQFRLSSAAIKELQEQGVDVPGVSSETIYDLFDRKA